MNGSYWKISTIYGSWNAVPRTGLAKETLRIPVADWEYFNKYFSVDASPNYPLNRDCLTHQRLGIDGYNKEHVWTLPTFVKSVINGCARKESHAIGSLVGNRLRNIGNTLSNIPLTLYASPDINRMHEQGLKKINEAQEVLQKKLIKAREESKKVTDKTEKQVLEIMIRSTEESINQLLELKKKMKRELKKKS